MSSENSVPLSDFRTVEIDDGVTITLGERLSPEAMSRMVQVGDLFVLKPGTYAGADEIDVQLGVGGAVQQMDFIYGPKPDYTTRLIQFEAELGRPTGQDDKSATWEDAATRFILTNDNGGSYSTLTNLAPTGS